MKAPLKAVSLLSLFDFDAADESASDVTCKSLPYYRKIASITHIERSIFSTYRALGSISDAFSENERLLAFSESCGELIWLAVSASEPRTLEQAERCLSLASVAGAITSELSEELLTLTDKHRSRLFVTESCKSSPEECLRFANAHPNTRLILSVTLGVPMLRSITNVKNGNIFVALNGQAMTSNRILEHSIELGIAERLLFADGGCSFVYPRVICSDIGESEKRAILTENARGLFVGKELDV